MYLYFSFSCMKENLSDIIWRTPDKVCVQYPRLTHVDLSLGWNSATGKDLTHLYGKWPLGWEIIPSHPCPFSMNFQNLHEVK